MLRFQQRGLNAEPHLRHPFGGPAEVGGGVAPACDGRSSARRCRWRPTQSSVTRSAVRAWLSLTNCIARTDLRVAAAGPAGPLSLKSRKCQVACGIGHHCSPGVQMSKPPCRLQDSDGSLWRAQLQIFNTAVSGLRASTKTRTPCQTVTWLRRITPPRSRKLNVLVARPAPSWKGRCIRNVAGWWRGWR